MANHINVSLAKCQRWRHITWDKLLQFASVRRTESASALRRCYLQISSRDFHVIAYKKQRVHPHDLSPSTSIHIQNLYSSRNLSSQITSSNSSMDAQTAYGLLKLVKFSKAEIEWRFDQIVRAGWRWRGGVESSLNDRMDYLQGEKMR